MVTSLRFLKKWFTLVEIVIVINIIGILFVALYPSLNNYIYRTREFQYRLTLEKFVEMVGDYIADNGGIQRQVSWVIYHAIPIDPNATGDLWNGTYVHEWLKQYFHATPEREEVLNDLVGGKMLNGRFTSWGYAPVYILSNETLANWWYIFPNRNPADTQLFPQLFFWIDGDKSIYHGECGHPSGKVPPPTNTWTYSSWVYNGVPYPEGTECDWSISGTSLGADVDKLCLGWWQVDSIIDFTNTFGTVISCTYFLQ